MTDLASLNFQIDSTQAVSARDALNQLAQASVSTAEAAQRTQHAYSQVAAAIRDQTLAAQDFTRANQNASNVLDGLVDRLERLRRGFSAFDGPVTELRRATEQLDAIGRSFGTTASGMENFTRQARQLGMDAAETVQALTRIQAALDNVTASGRQARQVMENYGVSLNGLSRNDADRALRAFVEAQRGFAADSTTMSNFQAVLGPMSPEALMRMSYPSSLTATQQRDQRDALEANRLLTGTSEQLSATIRQRDDMQARLSNLRGTQGSIWDWAPNANGSWNPFNWTAGIRWDGQGSQLATLEGRERAALARPRTGDPLDWGEAPNTPWTETRRYRRNNMIIEGVGALDEFESPEFGSRFSNYLQGGYRRLLNRLGVYNPNTFGRNVNEFGEEGPISDSDAARAGAGAGGPLVNPNTDGIYGTIRRMDAMSGTAGYRQRREAVWNARQSMGVSGLTEEMSLEEMLSHIQNGPRGGERISALNSLFGAFTTNANRDLTRAQEPLQAFISNMAGGNGFAEALRAQVAVQAGQGGADASTRLWTGFQQQLGQGWMGVGNLQFANSQNLMGGLSGASPERVAAVTREMQIQQQTRQLMLAAEQQEGDARDRAVAKVRELQDALRSAMGEQDRLNQSAAMYRLENDNGSTGRVTGALLGAYSRGGTAGLSQTQWMLQNGAGVLLSDKERSSLSPAQQQDLVQQRLSDPAYARQVAELNNQRTAQQTQQNVLSDPAHQAAMLLAQAGTSGDPLERIRQMRQAQLAALEFDTNLAGNATAIARRRQELNAGWGRDDTQAGASYMFGLQSTNADLLWQLGAFSGGGGGMVMGGGGGGRGFSPNSAAFSPSAGVNILDVLADLRNATGLNVGYTSHHRPGSGGQHRHGNALDLDLSPFSTDDRQAIARWLAQDGRVGGMGMYGVNDPMLHFDLGQGWNTRRAWGPNRSYTSLGQTPEWFQEIANGFRGGSFTSQAGSGGGGGAPAGTPRMGSAAGGPGMSAEDIVFGGDWIQAQMAARQGARGTMGVNLDAAAQEQYTQRVLQALVAFEQGIARTTVALRDGEARLATYSTGGTTYDRGLMGAQQNDTEYRRIDAIVRNPNTPAALRARAERDLQARAEQIKGSYDQSLDLQGNEANRQNQWRAEDLEYLNDNFMASDATRTRGLSMMRARRSAMDRYSGMSNRDALVERDTAMAGRLAELEETQKRLSEMRGAFQSIGEMSFQAFGQAARGAMTFRQALQQVSAAASDMLMRIVGKRAGDQLGDWFSQGIGALFGGSKFGAVSSVDSMVASSLGLAGATGLAFVGGHHVATMASGGIVSAPTYRAMASGGTALIGEAGDEAVLPLKRGPDGRLGVANAGGGNAPNVTVHVNTSGSSGNSAADHKHAKKVGDEVSRAVEGIVLDVMRKQARPGGMFGPGGLGSGIR